MAQGRRRDLKREAYWRDAQRRQQSSGLSVRQWCLREGVRESALHFWRRALAQRDGRASGCGAASPGKLPKPTSGPTGAPAFVQLLPIDSVPQEPKHPGRIVIGLRGGRRMLLPPGMDLEAVARLAHALESPEDSSVPSRGSGQAAGEGTR